MGKIDEATVLGEGNLLKIGWFSTARDQAARQFLQDVHDNIKYVTHI